MPGSTRHPRAGCHAGLDPASMRHVEELFVPSSGLRDDHHPPRPHMTEAARSSPRTGPPKSASTGGGHRAEYLAYAAISVASSCVVTDQHGVCVRCDADGTRGGRHPAGPTLIDVAKAAFDR